MLLSFSTQISTVLQNGIVGHEPFKRTVINRNINNSEGVNDRTY